MTLPALRNEYEVSGVHQLHGLLGLAFCKFLDKQAKAQEQPWLVQTRILSPAWHTAHSAARRFQRPQDGTDVTTSFLMRLDVLSPGKKGARAAPRIGASKSHSATL